MNAKLIITDKGDMSVGIFPTSWEIECPFSEKDGIDDTEMLEGFRADIIIAYGHFCSGRCVCEYDFEMKYKDTDGNL